MELEEKIKTVSDEINCLCDEHEISEERVLYIADLIKQREQFKFTKGNEVWSKIVDPYFDIVDFENYFVPENVKLGIHYQENQDWHKIDMIKEKFDVDINDIYYNGYSLFSGEELKEYENLINNVGPQNNKFILWCLTKEYKFVRIFMFASMSKGYYYEVFIAYNEEISKEKIQELNEYVKNYCNGYFDQYGRNNDEVLDYCDLITIFESELPGKDLTNIDEVKSYLSKITGTNRNIIIE